MNNPKELQPHWSDIIAEALKGLDYGSLNITVHEGQIIQIDRTEKQRFPLQKKTGAKHHSNVSSWK